MDRKPLIAGNWKLNKNCSESVEYIKKFGELVKGVNDVEILLAPPFTSLYAANENCPDNINLSSQDLYINENGAYTGQISPGMVLETGCKYAIIGHSEMRQFFGDTDSLVNEKIKASISVGLKPILCIGETEIDRDLGNTFSVLDKQVRKGLESFSESDLKDLVIAYEPVWAIGTGKTATTEIVQEVHNYLRDLIAKMFQNEFSEQIRILYGGSVKPSNVSELMNLEDVDGALVGGASLDPLEFSKIVKFKG